MGQNGARNEADSRAPVGRGTGDTVAGRLAALALIALAAGGCAYMRFEKPPDPTLAKCGTLQTPFWYWLDEAQEVVYREAGCIETRHDEGYSPALPEAYFFFISSGSLYTGKPTYDTR
jgi:hypothetical protein